MAGNQRDDDASDGSTDEQPDADPVEDADDRDDVMDSDEEIDEEAETDEEVDVGEFDIDDEVETDADETDADDLGAVAEAEESVDPAEPIESKDSVAKSTNTGGAQAAPADGPKTKGADEVFCSSCGEAIKQQAEVCPHCGVRQQGSSSSGNQEKDPAIAALLSGITSGWAGQIYNGQIVRGVAILVVQIINFFLIFVGIGLLTWPLVWILGTYDAYNQAKKINSGEVTP